MEEISSGFGSENENAGEGIRFAEFAQSNSLGPFMPVVTGAAIILHDESKQRKFISPC